MKIPFTGSTPINSTEETEKSATHSAYIASTDVPNPITPTPQLSPKIDEVSIISLASTVPPNPVPDTLVYKYNRYCDIIYERIGAILRQSYDPVNVRLSTSITHKQSGAKKSGQKKKKKRWVFLEFRLSLYAELLNFFGQPFGPQPWRCQWKWGKSTNRLCWIESIERMFSRWQITRKGQRSSWWCSDKSIHKS